MNIKDESTRIFTTALTTLDVDSFTWWLADIYFMLCDVLQNYADGKEINVNEVMNDIADWLRVVTFILNAESKTNQGVCNERAKVYNNLQLSD